jgi:3-deoxy-manno-octulosonate cytidylyltransferase (CMP-KDO synthetase)
MTRSREIQTDMETSIPTDIPTKIRAAVVIPARYGSTRFPGKPLAPIAGKLMIQRVYEAAARARDVLRVAVATDDARIADAVASFGGVAVMTDPNHRSGTDRIREAVRAMDLPPDAVVINVQGDQPLLDPACIEDLIAPFRNGDGVEMSTLAFPISDPAQIANPTQVKVVLDVRGDALYFSRSPIPFRREPGDAAPILKHLGLYAYTRRFLEIFAALPEGRLEAAEKLEQLRALEYGHRIRVVTVATDSREVDVPEDIAAVERILRERKADGPGD